MVRAACVALAGLGWAGVALAEVVEARVGLVLVQDAAPLPLTRLEEPAENDGIAGAEVGLADNATTGRFLGHTYALEVLTPTPEEAVAAVEAARAGGVGFFAIDAKAALLEEIAAAVPEALVLNIGAEDDALRLSGCEANLFHVIPSRAMKADALAQYLVWKKWDRWLLIHGSHPEDIAMAEAYRRAAGRFGADIVEERVYEDTGGARRSDSGHVLVQRQMPVFTQNARRHDVVIAADENEVFGLYLPYRTWDPRPVAGDAGLRVRDWHPGSEGWGGTQLQTRFEKHANRYMSGRDYLAWLAVRIVGEGVTRTESADPQTIRAYLRSDEFEIPGFKGLPLSFRPWNQQLRQGILLADGPLVVSVSPQEEFLHQTSQLDTLGYDEPETECSLDD
ncbi:branched-chain amino acid ABC transporter substrate-binding protein [Marinibacterium profundimaris]|uniref:Branched-chain amino acid ABC transporter substrate-binding protein n=1 Tax=Marinibacterium profundimaris TaxID=1679460 RepID=A0A225NRG0_9RHOB|nr:branched-chain amino acid ABC transporter substrate-binding protein [Marinibacterium profundimaris]